MTFRAGELDQRVTFQKRQSTSDGMGGSSFVWVNIDVSPTVWGHVRPNGGKENIQFERVNAEAGYLFVIRNRQDILESYRILWDNEPFNITVAKKPKTRALYLEIEAERGVAQ